MFHVTFKNNYKHMKEKANIEIGLILCIIGIAITLYSFNRTWILILAPVLLFIISLAFSRNKYLFVFINSLSVLPYIVIFVGLRLSIGENIEIKSPIKYQMADMGADDPLRYNIEYHLNNRRVFLAKPVRDIQWLYIYRKDYQQLTPESPATMKEKNYTIEATFLTKKLLFGGYSKALLQKVEKIEGEPVIVK
jgi:hypothetical protein